MDGAPCRASRTWRLRIVSDLLACGFVGQVLMCSERNGDLGRPTADGDSGPYGSWLEIRRHAETSEPIRCPSLRAKRSNPGAAVRPSGLLAPRMLWPLDCFVARAPRNDGRVAADPIASVVIGRRLTRREPSFVGSRSATEHFVRLRGGRVIYEPISPRNGSVDFPVVISF